MSVPKEELNKKQKEEKKEEESFIIDQKVAGVPDIFPSWASVLFSADDLAKHELLTKEMYEKIIHTNRLSLLRFLFRLVDQPVPDFEKEIPWSIIASASRDHPSSSSSSTARGEGKEEEGKEGEGKEEEEGKEEGKVVEATVWEKWSMANLERSGKNEFSNLVLKVPSAKVLLALMKENRFYFLPMYLTKQDGKNSHAVALVIDGGPKESAYDKYDNVTHGHVYLLDPNGSTTFFGDKAEATVEYLLTRFVRALNVELKTSSLTKKEFTLLTSRDWNPRGMYINSPNTLFGGNCLMCTILLLHLALPPAQFRMWCYDDFYSARRVVGKGARQVRLLALCLLGDSGREPTVPLTLPFYLNPPSLLP